MIVRPLSGAARRSLTGLGLAALALLTPVVASAQTGDGAVAAWGQNNWGQCDVPAPYVGFTAVAGGSFHSLALKTDGSVIGWGNNDHGQCIVPSPNEDFVAIAAGHVHSLGLKNDGSIVAWGSNFHGACNVPALNSGFTAIAAGAHTLGLKNDGSISAWGANDWGQCVVPEPNLEFTAIAAGAVHSLGLKTDGTIVAWGYNALGQCDVPAPNEGFVAVAAGDYHSLGLKADGSIVAWGENQYGACNVPGTVWTPQPWEVAAPGPNSGFVAMDAGERHSIALKSDGSIVAWGGNSFGQCILPEPNSGFTEIAAGYLFSLAVHATAPVAVTGPDQSAYQGMLITLDGSGSSNVDGYPLTYTWTQTAGPAVSLNLSDPVHPTSIAPEVPVGGAVLTFELVANEGSLKSAPASVNITIKKLVADAGPNETVSAGTVVTLDATASYDPDGLPLAYSWQQTGGPAVTLTNANAAQATFTAPSLPKWDTLTFQVSVSNGLVSRVASTNVIVRAELACSEPGWLNGQSVPGVSGSVYATQVYNGALYAGGAFQAAGAVTASNIARWNGTEWASLGQGLNGPVYALTRFDNDTKLIAAGSFTHAGGVPVNGVAAWDGTAWTAVSSNPIGTVFQQVYALADYRGQLVAAGYFVNAGGTSSVAQLNGTIWAPLDQGVSDTWVNALAVRNNDLFAGGGVYYQGAHVRRWNGSSWTALGSLAGLTPVWWISQPEWEVYALTFGSSSQLIAAGDFGVARWDGANWNSLSALSNPVFALALHNNELIAGGARYESRPSALFYDKTWYGPDSPGIVARWDGSAWIDLRPGESDGGAASLASFSTNLVAGGWFSMFGNAGAKSIAKWDGQGWNSLGQGFVGPVLALGVYERASGDELVAAGTYAAADGTTFRHLAKWDGTSWSPLIDSVSQTGLNGDASDFRTYGDKLIVTGQFTQAGGSPANRIAQWDGATSTWSALGNGLNDSYCALAEYNNQLYAAARGAAIFGNRSYKWNGSTWTTLNPGAYPHGSAGSLVVYGGQLLAGGSFYPTTALDANTSVGILKWTGTTWAPFDSDSRNVNLVIHSGDLIAGGWFGFGFAVARWDAASSTWTPLGTELWSANRLGTYNGDLVAHGLVNGMTNSLVRWDGAAWALLGNVGQLQSNLVEYNRELIVGGNFVTFEGRVSSGWARWGCPPPVVTSTGSNVQTELNGGAGVPGGATINFDSTTSTGQTSVQIVDSVPPTPPNFALDGAATFYEIETTATFQGSITICLNYGNTSYDNPASLRLMHFEDPIWVDRTTDLDIANHTICGTVTSLSPFAVGSVTYDWSGLLQPINANGSSVFKLGRTVPVKFMLTGSTAGITNAIARLYVSQVSGTVTGTELEATPNNSADSGNRFRYDESTGQYIFNLGTGSLSQGTWRLRVDLGDGVPRTTDISLKR